MIVALTVGSAPAVLADFDAGLKAAQSGDFATALRELKPLAEQGDADAQVFMGSIYETGKGVPQDYKQAAKWYRKAAEQGHAGAQVNLGVMYINGTGVLSDKVLAHMWSNIAGANGVEFGAKNRATFEKVMTAAQVAEAQKLARQCMKKKFKGCGYE